MKVSLACINVPFKAYTNVFKCLTSKYLACGDFIEKFEEKCCRIFKKKYCVAVCNGTTADLISLMTLKVLEPWRTEVIMPSLTFPAQANAVILSGLKPIFVDVGMDMQMTMNFQPTEKTLCVFPVHLMGGVCKINSDMPVIEDSCQAMGVVGDSLASTYSLFATHTISTGEGGFILTDNTEFYKIARSIRNHGRIGEDFNFGYFGFNGKMSNVLASIGCALIDDVYKYIEMRKSNVSLMNKLLGLNVDLVSPHGYPIIYKTRMERDEALAQIKHYGIECRKLMACIPDLLPYRKFGVFEIPNARELSSRGLYVPCHQNLDDSQIMEICDAIPRP